MQRRTLLAVLITVGLGWESVKFWGAYRTHTPLDSLFAQLNHLVKAC